MKEENQDKDTTQRDKQCILQFPLGDKSHYQNLNSSVSDILEDLSNAGCKIVENFLPDMMSGRNNFLSDIEAEDTS